MNEAAPQPRPIVIAAGSIADLDDVLAVMEAAFTPDFGERWTRSQCAGILPLAGVHLMVAKDRTTRTRGFSLIREVEGESELLLLAVDPAMQRQGIGGALLQHFIDHGRAHGLARLHLEVRDGNPAVAMYEAAGFVTKGRRVDYYRGRDRIARDALTMAMNI